MLLGCSLLYGCNRNIEDKRSEFEKATTTPFETTDKQTDEVESSTAEPSFIEWGIYVSNDNFNEFITIDDMYISFWDISKFDIGKMPEYYGEKGLPQCCKIYNRIEFLEHNDIFVSEEKIIFNDNEYIYFKEFLYEDINDYNFNYTGISQYDEIINKLIEIRFSENGYDSDYYYEANLSRQWKSSYTFQSAGFFLVDLDGDNNPEMLMGENTHGTYIFFTPIYEIYTIKDGNAVKLCNGTGNNCYLLCENNLIYSEGCGSASDPVGGFHKLQNGELVFQYSDTGVYPDESQIPIELTLFCVPKLD